MHPDEFSLLAVLADIRQKTGVGDKPMLFELADAIAKKISDSAHKDDLGDEYRSVFSQGARYAHSNLLALLQSPEVVELVASAIESIEFPAYRCNENVTWKTASEMATAALAAITSFIEGDESRRKAEQVKLSEEKANPPSPTSYAEPPAPDSTTK